MVGAISFASWLHLFAPCQPFAAVCGHQIIKHFANSRGMNVPALRPAEFVRPLSPECNEHYTRPQLRNTEI